MAAVELPEEVRQDRPPGANARRVAEQIQNAKRTPTLT
jgi:hypothetical protein